MPLLRTKSWPKPTPVSSSLRRAEPRWPHGRSRDRAGRSAVPSARRRDGSRETESTAEPETRSGQPVRGGSWSPARAMGRDPAAPGVETPLHTYFDHFHPRAVRLIHTLSKAFPTQDGDMPTSTIQSQQSKRTHATALGLLLLGGADRSPLIGAASSQRALSVNVAHHTSE